MPYKLTTMQHMVVFSWWTILSFCSFNCY